MCTLDRAYFDARSLERPAIVRLEDGTWRLYVCCASPSWPASKQWWTELLEADDPSGFADAMQYEVFRADDVALKDPVIRRRNGCMHMRVRGDVCEISEQEALIRVVAFVELLKERPNREAARRIFFRRIPNLDIELTVACR